MKKCIICGSLDQQTLYDQTLLKCAGCGFVTANLEIGQQELAAIYSEKYFKGDAYDDYVRDKDELQHNFRARLKSAAKFIPAEKLKRIFEIGCAYGFFGEVVTRELQAEYTGIDIAAEATAYARKTFGLDAVCGDYLASYHHSRPFDTVFMWDVIEHLQDPVKVVAKVSSAISPGGFIVITTGDIGALLPRMQGRKWRMIVPPIHLHYFNKKSITKLLAINGFRLVDISYPSVSRSLKMIFYSLFILNREKSPAFMRKIYSLIPGKMHIALNTYDIMVVVAQKE
ncbi:MAG: class I SAM-dependent methyltransferase [Bacteroidota bacterium]